MTGEDEGARGSLVAESTEAAGVLAGITEEIHVRDAAEHEIRSCIAVLVHDAKRVSSAPALGAVGGRHGIFGETRR